MKFACDYFAIDAKKYTIDSDTGFLHLPLTIAKVGIMDYPESGERRYMPPDVLKAALPSLDYAIITESHEGGLINIDNIKDHQRGIIKPGSIFDSQYIKGNGIIQSRKLAEDILAKKVEQVSAGYRYKVDGLSGNNEYGTFDTSYTSVKYNHVTAVYIISSIGRAGKDVKFEIDQKGKKMANIERELTELKIGKDHLLSKVIISFDKDSKSAVDAMYSREQKLVDTIRKQDDEIIALKSSADANKEAMDTLKTAQDGMIKKGNLNDLTAELLDVRQAALKIGLDCKQEVDSHIIKQKILEKVLPKAYKNLKNKELLKNKSAVDAAYDACKENMGFNIEVNNTQQALDNFQPQNPALPAQPQSPLFSSLQNVNIRR